MSYSQQVIDSVRARYPDQLEFIQSVEELVVSLDDFLQKNPRFEAHRILERLTEPDRVISFRVTWVDDTGHVQVNRGYRVQFSSTLGPYKGGLRFHPSVNLSVLKFLGFEQIFKNSLTGLWLGGAKGGADFDPKGKSDNEVMRFCQAFMSELYPHIGPDTDVPAGDIGVGGREIGYLFGWYKKLAGEFHGSLTGKGVDWGGSNLRPEATGYGLLYFAEAMVEHIGQKMAGKTVVISGSGNVAQYATEKALEMGTKVLTVSDSAGFIHDPDGITNDKLEFIKQLKNVRRGRISAYAEKFKGATYHAGAKPWSVKSDAYLPCATQNEIDEHDAQVIAAHQPLLVAEGANMPTTPEGIEIFQKADILFAPAKASNAGGVAVSGLEMSQNMTRLSLTHQAVDAQLRQIMNDIHAKCVQYGASEHGVDYARGANVAGFVRVAGAMIEQGVT